MLQSLELFNTRWALMLTYPTFLIPFCTWLLMGYFRTIPFELEEAAQVDGAGFWRKLFEVTIPMSLPVTAVATLFGAVLVFTDMSVVFVLTRGGPVDEAEAPSSSSESEPVPEGSHTRHGVRPRSSASSTATVGSGQRRGGRHGSPQSGVR